MADKKTLSVLIKAIDAFSPTMKVLNSKLRIVKKSFNEVGRAGDKLSQKLGIPITLFGVSALGGIGSTVTGFADRGEEISNAVKKIGGNAADLQVFRKAAMLANIPVETLDKGLTKLNKNIAEGASGKNKEFAAMMTKLRIPLRNANGELRTAGEILPELSDAFQKNTNAAVRGRIAAVAFGGKMGAELIPMLVGGGASLEEIRAKLVHLGAIMSDESVKSADKLAEKIKWLQIAGRGLGNTIGAVLAPSLIPLIERFTEWVAANREIVASKVKDFVLGLAKAIESIDWKALGDSLKSIGAVIGLLVNAIGGWGRAMTIVAIILNASILAAIFNIVAALAPLGTLVLWVARGFMTLLLATGPIGLVVAAVALLALAVYKIYQNWEPIKAWFVNLWADIKAIFTQNIADLIRMVIPFAGLLDKVTGGQVTAAINSVVGNTPTGAAAVAPSLAAASAGTQQVKGSIDVNFNGAPPGTRVTEGKTNSSGFSLNPDVGYNWATAGVPL